MQCSLSCHVLLSGAYMHGHHSIFIYGSHLCRKLATKSIYYYVYIYLLDQYSMLTLFGYKLHVWFNLVQ